MCSSYIFPLHLPSNSYPLKHIPVPTLSLRYEANSKMKKTKNIIKRPDKEVNRDFFLKNMKYKLLKKFFIKKPSASFIFGEMQMNIILRFPLTHSE